MPRYPLEWGWHTDQPDPKTDDRRVFTPVTPTFLGRVPETDTRTESQPIVPVASGDLWCEKCPSGGSWGTTGMYSIDGQVMCRSCAVKTLKIENLSGGQQSPILEPHLLMPKK